MSVCDSICFKAHAVLWLSVKVDPEKTCLVERILYYLPQLTDKPLHHIHYVYGVKNHVFYPIT